MVILFGSLPTRERGLKHAIYCENVVDFKSLHTRERGLKQRARAGGADRPHVAPHAGARIETARSRSGLRRRGRSLPTRERGLKQLSPARVFRLFDSLPTRELVGNSYIAVCCLTAGSPPTNLTTSRLSDWKVTPLRRGPPAAWAASAGESPGRADSPSPCSHPPGPGCAGG